MQGLHRVRRIRRRPAKKSTAAIAKKNRRDISQLKSNLDWKFKDTIVDDAVVSTTGTVQPQIFVIGNGDTSNQKDGLKIVIKKVSCRFQFTLPSSTDKDAAADTLRIMLLKDKQANGALPAVAQILTGTDIFDFREPPNKRRFTVLFDKTVSINSNGGFGNGTTNTTLFKTMNWEWSRRMNFPIYYNNSVSTGAIAQINSNNLVMFYISQDGLCGVLATVRVEYTD